MKKNKSLSLVILIALRQWCGRKRQLITPNGTILHPQVNQRLKTLIQ